MDSAGDDSRCSCCNSPFGSGPGQGGGGGGYFNNITVCALEDAVSTACDGRESPLVRLKAILTYLRRSISPETECCIRNYVDNIPTAIKDFIYRELERAGQQTVQYFYEYLMTTMAEALSSGLFVIGFKVLIQMLAFKYPHATECCLAKMAVLRNSFEDDENICMKLLWGFSQAGYKDVNVGIRVWCNLLAPVIGVPRYSGYVCRYIARIIDEYSLKGLNLSNKDFQVAIETLVQLYPVSEKLLCSLQIAAKKLAKKYVELCENLSVAFMVLLKNTNERNNFAEMIVEALYLDPCNVATLWDIIAEENYMQTGLVLAYIDENYSSLGICLSKIPAFFEFLNKVRCNSPVYHLADSIVRKLIIDNLDKAPKKVSAASKKQGSSNAASKGGCSGTGCRVASTCCKWVFGSLFLVLAIAGAINYDVHSHGGVFEKSATGKFLKDTGMLPYAQTVFYSTMSNGARGYQFMEKNVPVYSKQTGTVLKPYWEFTKDLAVVAGNGVKQGFNKLLNLVDEKSPVVVDFIEKYAPGLPQKIKVNSVKAWVFLSNSSYDLFSASRTFVNEKVLIGKLSPESLGQMLNETQTKAGEYYSWFKNRVQDYAKL